MNTNSVSEFSGFVNPRRSYLLLIKILAIMVPLVVSSCSNYEGGGDKIIDIESAVGKGSVELLSNYASDIEYIALETSDESLLGRISKVDVDNEKIYVADQTNSIKIFDRRGNYIKTFSRSGRGPQEYMNILDFLVDRASGNLNIMERSGAVYEYDSEGNFISKINAVYSNSRCRTLALADSKNRVLIASWYSQYAKGENGLLYGVTHYRDTNDIISEITRLSISSMTLEPTSKGTVVITSPYPPDIFRFGDETRVIFKAVDTVFSVNKSGEVYGKFFINTGKYKIPHDLTVYEFASQDNPYISLDIPAFETATHLLLAFDMRSLAHEIVETVVRMHDGKEVVRKHTTVYSVYDKKSGKFTLLNQPENNRRGFRDDIKGGLPFWPTDKGSGNELIRTINALDVITSAEKYPDNQFINSLASKLDENDNPVVVIVTPK